VGKALGNWGRLGMTWRLELGIEGILGEASGHRGRKSSRGLKVAGTHVIMALCGLACFHARGTTSSLTHLPLKNVCFT
jgi:hypothetical protein